MKELNIPTKITRTEDEYLPKEERIRRILSLYNNSPNTILISNHINAGGGEGAEVVYSLKNNSTLADLVLENIKEAGQVKRKAYQRRLPENPNKDYYYILRETGNTEPILIEYGFIDNMKDANKLKNNLLSYAEGVVKALAEYTNYPYIPPKQESTSKDIYIIQKGDTLYSIALKNNTTVEELKKLNNLSSNTLTIGQELKLPTDEKIEGSEYDLYIVQKGDSLWKISRMYNISVTELIEMNQLKDLTLQIGDTLLVPKKEDSTYIVQKGDTLWSIARKLGLEVNNLKKLNQLESNLLSIGQILKIK